MLTAPATPPPDWAAQLVHGLGAPVTPAAVGFFNDLAAEERGLVDPSTWGQHNHGGANNPIDTVLGVPGSTAYNSTGVQNYPDWGTGLAANVSVLEEAQYSGFLKDLRSGTASLTQLEQDYNLTPAAGAGNITFATPGSGYGNVVGQSAQLDAAVSQAHSAPTKGGGGIFNWNPLTWNILSPIEGHPVNVVTQPFDTANKAAGKAASAVGSATFNAFKDAIQSSLGVRALILIVSIVVLLIGLKELTSDNGPGQTVIAPIQLAASKAAGAAKSGAKTAAEAAPEVAAA